MSHCTKRTGEGNFLVGKVKWLHPRSTQQSLVWKCWAQDLNPYLSFDFTLLAFYIQLKQPLTHSSPALPLKILREPAILLVFLEALWKTAPLGYSISPLSRHVGCRGLTPWNKVKYIRNSPTIFHVTCERKRNPLQNRYYEARSGSGAKDTGEGEGVFPQHPCLALLACFAWKTRKNNAYFADSGGKGKSKRAGKKCRSLLFFAPFFSARFGLSVALTICSWVSEDGKKWSSTEPQLITRVLCHTRFPWGWISTDA